MSAIQTPASMWWQEAARQADKEYAEVLAEIKGIYALMVAGGMSIGEVRQRCEKIGAGG